MEPVILQKTLKVTTEEDGSTQKTNLRIILPYVRTLSNKSRGELKKHNIKTAFKSSQTISFLLNNEKDKVPRKIQRGVYKIPCSCGKFYVGKTHAEFRKQATSNTKMPQIAC